MSVQKQADVLYECLGLYVANVCVSRRKRGKCMSVLTPVVQMYECPETDGGNI